MSVETDASERISIGRVGHAQESVSSLADEIHILLRASLPRKDVRDIPWKETQLLPSYASVRIALDELRRAQRISRSFAYTPYHTRPSAARSPEESFGQDRHFEGETPTHRARVIFANIF